MGGCRREAGCQARGKARRMWLARLPGGDNLAGYMTDDLAARIKKVYPAGTTESWDEAALDSEERDGRPRSALRACADECGLACELEAGKPAYKAMFTQQEHPSFYRWLWQMSNPEKLAWIQGNGGPYPVLWLTVSRVADYYYHYFNHWVPGDDTGRIGPDCKHPLNAKWRGYELIIRERLERAGFRYLTDDLAREETPFVLERDYDAIPEDDPRWDEDDFQPPLVPTTVHECLFSY